MLCGQEAKNDFFPSIRCGLMKRYSLVRRAVRVGECIKMRRGVHCTFCSDGLESRRINLRLLISVGGGAIGCGRRQWVWRWRRGGREALAQRLLELARSLDRERRPRQHPSSASSICAHRPEQNSTFREEESSRASSHHNHILQTRKEIKFNSSSRDSRKTQMKQPLVLVYTPNHYSKADW